MGILLVAALGTSPVVAAAEVISSEVGTAEVFISEADETAGLELSAAEVPILDSLLAAAEVAVSKVEEVSTTDDEALGSLLEAVVAAVVLPMAALLLGVGFGVGFLLTGVFGPAVVFLLLVTLLLVGD